MPLNTYKHSYKYHSYHIDPLYQVRKKKHTHITSKQPKVISHYIARNMDTSQIYIP